MKTSKGVPSPFIELELASVPGDTEFRRRTPKADANALCPLWHNETFDVDVCLGCPFAVVSVLVHFTCLPSDPGLWSRQ